MMIPDEKKFDEECPYPITKDEVDNI